MRVGQTIVVTYKTKDRNGALIDANAVTLRIYDPVNVLFAEYSLADNEVTRISTGTYEAEFQVDKAGMWSVDATAQIGSRYTSATDDLYVESL